MAEPWDRVKEIFEAVFERSPAERAQLLAQACGADAALRAEVESLLAAYDGSTDFMEAPAWETASPGFRGGPDPYEGRLIGAYRAIRRIGHGGMGAVYLAARADATYQKRVAIKIVKRGMDTEEILHRFRNERQTLASLDHPNIARLLDGGTTAEGLPYFVMDYVEGQRIDDYCDAGRLTIRERIALFRSVCGAVQYAHQNLIVHRDLKPDNILVTPEGVPKLVDFGIAKVLNPEAASQAADLTRPMGRVMTLRYASPEQVRGGPITTASDVYSLGVLLFELLTGRRPYGSPETSQADVARAICDEDPPSPSAALARPAASGAREAGEPDLAAIAALRATPPGVLKRQLAGDVDAIVLMALRKEPQRRYGSVERLAEDLRRHLEGLPVLAQPDTVAYRSRKFVRRHRAGVIAASLVLVSLVAGIAGTSWQARVAAEQRDRASLEAEKAKQINAFVQSMLGSADPYTSGGGKQVTVAHALDEASRRVDAELGRQPEVAAAVRTTIGTTYLGLGIFESAESHLRFALETRRRLLGSDHPDVVDSLNNLAALYMARGDIAAGEPLLREALTICGRIHSADTLQEASTLNNLGSLLLSKGAHDEAEQVHRRSLAIRRALLGENDPAVAESLNDLGVVLGTKGDFAGAEPLHRQAVQIIRQTRPPDHPDIAATMTTLAYVVDGQKNYAAAEPLYREALELRQKVLGDSHPDVAWTKYNYASLLHLRGKYGEAETMAREVLALRGKTLPEGHPMIPAAMQVLGMSLADQGHPERAEPVLRESLEIRRKSYPAGHWLIATAENTLGDCLTALGRFNEAEALLVPSYASIRKNLGDKHDRTQDAVRRLVSLYEASGRPEAAAQYRAVLARTQTTPATR
jgi:serine/threonine-protein kinase